MCKFTNRLFVFALCCLLACQQMVCVLAKPLTHSSRNDNEDLGALIALSALMNSQDVHYDQRQKGDENYRIKLDGFYIGLPQEDSSALLLFTDDMFESLGEFPTNDDYLLSFGKNKPAVNGVQTPPTPLTSQSSLDTDRAAAASEVNLNLSTNAQNSAQNLQAMALELPAPKKYLEARHGVNSGSRTKSYISQFLKLLKRGRKH
ncbi:uncharacterized protein LOC135951256 [Calliphora vicina]|uniref:uncharacterized protein LOC135951256 n=1 Tax=Calliphora vicina TaxID=7373 RepID=UPI00325AE7DC